jgi:SLAP domain-containing protein
MFIMQQLQFEASWEKALASQDRQKIERVFNETKCVDRSDIICTPIREAINHKEELLITVLVHNFTDKLFTFDNVRLVYSIQGEIIADHTFTVPALSIPANVSMPWTFIFPKDCYHQKTSYQNGSLEIR